MPAGNSLPSCQAGPSIFTCNALSHSKRINNIVIRLVNALASGQLKSILCDGSLISGGCAALQWCFARASAN